MRSVSFVSQTKTVLQVTAAEDHFNYSLFELIFSQHLERIDIDYSNSP
jgi:hypothetical protein